MRALPAVREAPDLPTLVRSGLEAQSTLGRSLRLPSENASAEDRAAFLARVRQVAPELVSLDLDSPEARADIMTRLGRPAEASAYQAPEIQLPQGVEVDLSPVEAFRSIAHEAGLTQDQFNTVVERMSAGTVEAAQQRHATNQQAMQELANEWGYAFDGKAAAIRQFARASGAPESLLNALDRNRVDAATLRWLDAVAQGAAEGQGAVDTDGQADLPLTTQEAQAQVNEILANKEHPYWVRTDPRHAQAVEEYLHLTRLAMGATGRESQSGVPIAGSELDGDTGGAGGIAFSGTV